MGLYILLFINKIQLCIFQWQTVIVPSKCHDWFVPSLLPSRADIAFCGLAFCCDRCRNECSAFTPWCWKRQEQSFGLGVKVVMSVRGFFPGKILPQSCTCVSKTVAAALASCPSPQAAALHRGTELWTSGDLLSSLDWGTWKAEIDPKRKNACTAVLGAC